MSDRIPADAAAKDAAPYDPANDGWALYEDDGFIGLVGPIWQRPLGENFEYAFIVQKKHRNRRGVVQGGMLMTFADRAMGSTASIANGRKPQATLQMSYQFVAAVHVGEFVRADVSLLRRTKSVMFVDARLLVEGRVVGLAQGVWKVLSPSNPDVAIKPY